MLNAYISGTGYYVPPTIVTNNDLRDTYGIETSHEWIHPRTGIDERRYAADGVGSADLGLKAAEMAIANAGIDAKDIDMILFATLSPEHCFPGSGVYLQEKLGLCANHRFTPAMDIRNQCSGFLYGLGTATSMVKSGACKHVLLVGAEVHSHALDLSTRGRTVASLFGDGAGAVIVSATEEDRGVRVWKLGADGRHADVLAQRVWDIRNKHFIPMNEEGIGQVQPEMMFAQMNGRTVFKHAVQRMLQGLMEVMQDQGIASLDEIDLFAFHQANLRINEYVADSAQIPREKLLTNINKFGNTTAATIPLLLAEAEETGRLKRGMKVASVAFGSGFTWGAALIDW